MTFYTSTIRYLCFMRISFYVRLHFVKGSCSIQLKIFLHFFCLTYRTCMGLLTGRKSFETGHHFLIDSLLAFFIPRTHVLKKRKVFGSNFNFQKCFVLFLCCVCMKGSEVLLLCMYRVLRQLFLRFHSLNSDICADIYRCNNPLFPTSISPVRYASRPFRIHEHDI
jgi:hypothetical protein